MFRGCLRYCRLELDACFASCATRSLKTDAGEFDGKEAFGPGEITACNMQGVPSEF